MATLFQQLPHGAALLVPGYRVVQRLSQSEPHRFSWSELRQEAQAARLLQFQEA
ncbi:hypothetical protein ECAD30_45790 [Escherichia coli AD30]|nr:hypothetical protein ECAD30_45790 [Escherichia coli AD30]